MTNLSIAKQGIDTLVKHFSGEHQAKFTPWNTNFGIAAYSASTRMLKNPVFEEVFFSTWDALNADGPVAVGDLVYSATNAKNGDEIIAVNPAVATTGKYADRAQRIKENLEKKALEREAYKAGKASQELPELD